MDLPVRRLFIPSDLLICSTSHSNKLAYIDFAKASLVSIAYETQKKSINEMLIIIHSLGLYAQKTTNLRKCKFLYNVIIANLHLAR